MKKEELIKKNGELESELQKMKDEDEKRRTTLSELLDSYEWNEDTWSHSREKKTVILDWLGIAFSIGELKADADYSIAIESKREIQEEISRLKEYIAKLEKPEQDECCSNKIAPHKS